MKAHGWVLKGPDGVCPETFRPDRDSAWESAFNSLQSNTECEWLKAYWKRWDASQREAKRRGYRLVRACVVEIGVKR